MISWRFVRIRMKRMSSCAERSSGSERDAQDGQCRRAHSVIMPAAHVLQACLYAVYDSGYRARILLSLFPFKDDSRMANDGHWLPSR